MPPPRPGDKASFSHFDEIKIREDLTEISQDAEFFGVVMKQKPKNPGSEEELLFVPAEDLAQASQYESDQDDDSEKEEEDEVDSDADLPEEHDACSGPSHDEPKSSPSPVVRM